MTDLFDLSELPADLRAGFNRQWERFIESAAGGAAPAPVTARTELPRVWIASDFVAAWCIRHPDRLVGLLGSGDLERRYGDGEMRRRLDAELAGVADEAALDRKLRDFRQREMVRVAWRDLAGFGALEDTMADVSDLADACIDAALIHHHEWLGQRFGTPRDEAGDGVNMVVLGLGKLGGRELNFSSDIDLIYAYDGGGETDGPKQISNQEFFIKLGRKIVGSLDRIDAGGFVFRTDLRLRPNGDSGPLVLPFAAMEHYYQTHGRDWERYALIKARVVAGDRRSGALLLEMLRPFVYRKYLDFSAFDAIREMKTLIERQLHSSGNANDIKLGRGGIREIEFMVQNHQLIRGGREHGLQTPSLHAAMTVLVELGVMAAADADSLRDSYRFLRNLEHRLQMVSDRQTQKLPDTPAEQARLAVASGHDDWNDLAGELERVRQTVHGLFSRVLETPQDAADDPLITSLDALWHGQLDEEEALAALATAGFRDHAGMPGTLSQFREGSLYRAFSNVERDRLDRLMPMALREAGRRPDAARAVTAFISVVEAIGRRSVYLSLLIENPLALRQLLHLCAASPWISRHIGRHPVVLDELLRPLRGSTRFRRQDLAASLQRRLAQVDSGDEEAAMNALREFQHARVLRVAAADVAGELDARDVEHNLSLLAEVLLDQVMVDARVKVEGKQGSPPGRAGIIAYGKFAAAELGYHSDLDIVVFFQPGEDSAATAAEYFFSRMGQRLIHLLSARTQAGALYELDMRLRPSGRSGTLVTSLKAFRDYQLNNAWTWEHQALVRARVVVGDDDLVAGFEAVRREVLARQRDDGTLREEIRDMRRRMREANCASDADNVDIKLDHGGIVDIEFLLQYLVLRHAFRHPGILEPRDTLALTKGLAGVGVIDADDARRLGEAYRAYLRRSLDLKLLDRPVLVPREELVAEREFVSGLWRDTFG